MVAIEQDLELPQQWGIYRVDLGQRVGTRPGKVRPCLAIQPREFAGAGLASSVVLPLTSRVVPAAHPLRVHLPAGIGGLRVPSDAMVDQLMAVGHDRFRGHIGDLPEALRDDVRAALREFLDL